MMDMESITAMVDATSVDQVITAWGKVISDSRHGQESVNLKARVLWTLFSSECESEGGLSTLLVCLNHSSVSNCGEGDVVDEVCKFAREQLDVLASTDGGVT